RNNILLSVRLSDVIDTLVSTCCFFLSSHCCVT
ncbi:erfK/YbiS/YcfS/YnhG family domain protein, partial [Vibrio parahaemolyticus V-223/04]